MKKISRIILIMVVVTMLFSLKGAYAATTNLTFNTKKVQGHISAVHFGKLSEVVSCYLQHSFGDQIDSDFRKEIADLFENEAIEMGLYSEIVFNEFNFLKSRRDRLTYRYQLCKRIFFSLWKKNRNHPRMIALVKILRTSKNAHS